ncbi:MAG: nitronate monooxygenase [Gammaproteobacteria bacterium]|nr:nitronate monooxygenase [Gammaproteobacteria bacterium]
MLAQKKIRDVVDNYRFRLGSDEYVPIMIGGMGVNISTAELALEACRLGGIGHISDAMNPFVSDKKFQTKFTKTKSEIHRSSRDSLDKTTVKFDPEELRKSQLRVVRSVMDQKTGDGAIFINVMEKLNMAAPGETLRARLAAALEGGIDGVTLSAGLHNGSLKLIEDQPRFRDVKIGIIVSSVRALKIFLRNANRVRRLPDYVIVEGPLAGGHLGFGDDWREYNLRDIVIEVLDFLKKEELNIPVLPAGGIFTGTDAVEYLQLGAAAVQLATRFTVTEECGLPDKAKQVFFNSREEDVFVSSVSPTGYPLRLLKSSPCIGSNIKPQCEPFGYILNRDGTCAYIDAYEATGLDAAGKKLPVKDKVCLCYHFSKYNAYTCGHYVYRLKDTSRQLPGGEYQLLTAEHVFKDYQFSREHKIALPAESADQPAEVG